MKSLHVFERGELSSRHRKKAMERPSGGLGVIQTDRQGEPGRYEPCRGVSRPRKETGNWYRTLFNGMTEGLVLYKVIRDARGRPRDFRITEVNRAFERLTGLRRGDVLGKTKGQVFPQDKAYWMRILKEAAHTGRSVRIGDYQSASRDKVFNLSVCRPASDQVAVLLDDITDRKSAEERARQAQKMEAIGRLAAGVAHDFRNQLTVIKGFSEMLLRRSLVKRNGLDKIQEIIKAAERSLLLTGQLLTISRKEMLQLRVVNLSVLVEDVAKAIHRMVGEDIRLHIRLTPEECFVKIDPRLFQQAVINLVANARDAMPNGGELTIETRPSASDDHVADRHPDLKPGPYASVAVMDAGCGMDDKTLARLFEPFFTSKPRGQGTGLGLAMVYGFIKQSRGTIEVHSRVGKGSTFRLFFPRVRRPPRNRRGAARTGRLPGGKETILLVEDETSVGMTVAESFREAGYKVIEASSAEDAMSLNKRQGGSIDALVTDVVLPGTNGVDLARRIQRVRPRFPILFMSGYADTELLRRGVDPVKEHVLPKPCSHETLLKTMRRLLDSAARA